MLYAVSRLALALALVAPAFAALAPVASAQAHPWDDVVVAVLDSGINPAHKAFAPGQVVAWRDFVNGRADPYDDLGHGTAVASMVGGIPAGSVAQMTPSHAPGVKLAIAKTLSGSNSAYWSDMIAAIEWSVLTAGADIISISIYNYGIRGGPVAPTEWIEQEFYDTISWARDQGVLVVILAGNGYRNAGLPSMSYFHVPSASDAALIVGGSSNRGLLPTAPLGDMEPEVVSDYSVYAACPEWDSCVKRTSGTSFATPLVAGAAARVLGVARSLGLVLTPDELETILKRNAVDGPAPPTLEGYGYVGAAAVASAEANLRNGTPHGGATTDVNAVYVEEAQRRARDAWRDWPPF